MIEEIFFIRAVIQNFSPCITTIVYNILEFVITYRRRISTYNTAHTKNDYRRNDTVNATIEESYSPTATSNITESRARTYLGECRQQRIDASHTKTIRNYTEHTKRTTYRKEKNRNCYGVSSYCIVLT